MPCRYWPIVGTFLLSMLLYVDRACMSAAKPAVAVILEESGKLDPSKKPSAADRTVTTEGGRFPLRTRLRLTRLESLRNRTKVTFAKNGGPREPPRF